MQAEGIDLPRCTEPTHPVPMLHSNSVKYCIPAPFCDLKLFLVNTISCLCYKSKHSIIYSLACFQASFVFRESKVYNNHPH